MSQPNQPTSKLTPQQIQEQEIQGLLQAPLQFGTNKTLINVNGQSSKLKSNKNSIVNYTLEQPIKLNIGDKVTLIESFVEERGLSIDTISFEEDVEEELRFLYYQQGDCQNCLSIAGQDPFTGVGADQKFACFPNTQDCALDIVGNFNAGMFSFPVPDPDGNIYLSASMLMLAGIQATFLPTLNYTGTFSGEIPTLPGFVNKNASLNANDVGFGATGQYYYGCEWYNPAEPGQTYGLNADPNYETNSPFDFYMRPLYGAATIKIPAGNYSVSALSDLINSQLDGNLTPNPNAPDGIKANALTNKLFNNTDKSGATQTMPFFDGITSEIDFNTETTSTYNPDSLIIGADTYQAYQRRRGGVMAKLFFNPFLSGQEYTLGNMAIRCGEYGNDPIQPAGIASKWAYIDGSDGAGGGITNDIFQRPPKFTRPQDIATCYDKTLFNSDSPNRIKFRRFQSNFFVHLDGFRRMFEGDPDNPTKSMYYKQEIEGNTLLENANRYKSNQMPTLGDMLLAKLGGQGQYYFGDTPTKPFANPNYDEHTFPLANGFPYRYPNNVLSEIGRFSTLFPVNGSFNSLFKGNDAQKPATDTYGAYQQFAGTASFTLDYDTTSANRFSIKNLHEPYKLPTTTPDTTTPTNLGGQQATLFNTPVMYQNNADSPVTLKSYRQLANFAGVYPIDSKSGVAVNNFAFNACKDTVVYKQLVEDINTLNTANVSHQLFREKKIFELFSKPYEDFFESDESAKEAWNKTFWARLGFTYEQFGQIDKNLEKIFTFTDLPQSMLDNYDNPGQFNLDCLEFKVPDKDDCKFVKQMGIVSHNSFNFSFIPTTDALGIGNVNAGGTATNQGYDMRGYTTATTVTATPKGSGVSGLIQNYVHVLTDSQPINANEFPSLNNGNNYLLIDSDIVKPNAKDANSNNSTIVGVMSKENASNDTIFSVNPVTFTVTEPKLLSTIQVMIRNPDGTLVSDDVVGKNNAFIFQIEQSIKPGNMTMEGF